MNEKALSRRLEIVASYLPAGAFFADIGSDHAYLPTSVCTKDPSAKAIAGEINEGPYQAAKRQVDKLGLNNKVKVVKGNGLSVITNDDPVDHVIIAGMGGGLIRTILSEGREKLHYVKRIIVQPNVDAEIVRTWFDEHGFTISAEEIIKEDGHIYEIIVADLTEKPAQYENRNKALMFGPYLIKEKNEAFKEKWLIEKLKRERILAQIKHATVIDQKKVNRLKNEVNVIEEVLKE